MPAITLGLAEVEERLRTVRRRLNAVTAQHSAYLSLSVVVVVLTAVLILALRGAPAAFRAAAWGGGGVCVAAVAWGVRATRRRWLDAAATAHLVDRRGALTDRLVTLVDLRARPRPSRLAPVLVAQLLALGTQWQPQRIAPRRVPRSVFALVLSLLALASTAFIERRPSPLAANTGAGTSSARGSAGSAKTSFAAGDSAGAPSSDGASQPGAPVGDLPQDLDGNGRDARDMAARGKSGPPGASAAKQFGDSAPGVSPRAPGEQPGSQPQSTAFSELPDRLQDAIRRAFHAEAIDRPRQLAARSDPNQHDPAAAPRGPQRDPRGDERRGAPKAASGAETQPKGADPAPQKVPGEPRSGDRLAQRQEGGAASQNYDGKSPAAGAGSSPGGPMDSKATGTTAGAATAKTFKLTITSFLRATEQKGNQPRQAGKKTTATRGLPATGSATELALNDRQLSDDALRKAEIPPEYEDIVRRVYSLRAEQ